VSELERCHRCGDDFLSVKEGLCVTCTSAITPLERRLLKAEAELDIMRMESEAECHATAHELHRLRALLAEVRKLLAGQPNDVARLVREYDAAGKL